MTTDDAAGFGQQLTAARLAAGKPTFKKIERAAWESLGAYAPTAETIRLYHCGTVTPEKADVVLVAFLADLYGVSVSTLSQTIADRAEMARDLLVDKLRCISECPGQLCFAA